jgi:radical SAM protein with 4Fe4S-binding SPASM domain
MSVKDCDSHKLIFHPKEVGKWLNNEVIAPLHAEIGITNKCNHRCKFCTLDWITHGSDSMDKNVMMNCLNDMGSIGVKSIYYAGEGEPTLHENLSDFIKYGKSVGISQSMSTNGSKFKDDIAENVLCDLSWIRFSVDAGNSAIYSDIHGVKESEYENVINNIRKSVEIKKKNKYKVNIGVQFVLMTENINSVEDLAKTVKDIGVDNFQVKPGHSHPKSSYSAGIYKFSYEYLKDALSKLEDESFTVVVRVQSMERLNQERNYESCHGFDFYSILDAKGNVVPCNVFYNNPEYIYGNIYNSSFKEIWYGERRKEIIEKITKRKFDMCGNYRCRLDVMNRYLERVKNPEENDEFI